MTRRENHQRFGIFAQHLLKHAQQRKFFVFQRAAAKQDWEGLGFLQTLFEFFLERNRLRRLNIEFQVAAGGSPLRECANFDERFGIFRALRQEKVDVLQKSAQHAAPAPVSVMRAVRDARIDHGNLRPRSLCQPQKIWPELGFGQDHQLWPQTFEVRSYGKSKIQGEVKDVFLAMALARQLLPGGGSCGNKNSRAWVRDAQLFD